MATALTAEKLALYRATAQARQREREAARAARHARAWDVANEAAALLREQFGATKVTVFGSLAAERWFGEASDIDLAVWGFRIEDYFAAVARLQGIDADFKIDLVMMEQCKPGLAEAVFKEGIML